MFYQPIVCLKTGRISGFESLVRWYHPERGIVSPAEFIPLAEETGLIIDLGRWIMEEACRQICVWRRKFSDMPLTVSVNLSGKQFMESDLVGNLAKLLQENELPPSCLKLEITESIIMNNADTITNMLFQLQNMSLDLYIDDFGTGYSSLSYLHRFPISVLKIDRSFIMRLDEEQGSEEIVRTIISLAQNLKMRVVAEGVETQKHLDKLRELNCEYGQGYFFSKPVDSEHTEQLLKTEPQW